MKLLKKMFPIYTREILLVIILTVIVILLQTFIFSKREQISHIDRPSFSEGDQSIILYYQREKGYSFDDQISLRIDRSNLKPNEMDEYLKNISKSLEESILSQNDNFQHIEKPIVLQNNFEKCTVEYSLYPNEIIDMNGWMDFEQWKDEEIIVIYYKIRLEEHEVSNYINLNIQKSNFSESYQQEFLKYKIQQQWLIENSKDHINRITLPDEVIFYNSPPKLSIKEVCSYLIILISICAVLSRLELKLQQELMLKKKRVQLTYLINNFILLFKTGMTIHKSLILSLKHRLDALPAKNELHKELEKVYSLSIQEMPLNEILNAFLDLFSMMEGRRFVRLIQQNLKQGDHLLVLQLEQLSSTMWEERIRRARKESEKASSKLVFPMLLIFIIILIITIVPTLIEVKNFF